MISRRTCAGAIASVALQGQNMFANAEAYERFMGRWSRLVAPLLVDFARLPEEGEVLDVGSGTGALAFAVAQKKPKVRVVGIDPSREYVAYAASRDMFPPRARFETGDAQSLRFADSAFGGSVSLLVFNFIPDPGKALREVRRVTAGGGSISAAVWDYPEGMKMLRVFWDAAVGVDAGAEKRDEKHMPLCRPGELAKLWTQGGLENVEERPLDVEMKFQSFADYWEPFLLGQGPAGAYASSLSKDALTALQAAVRSRLSVKNENAGFTLPGRVWAVRGTAPIRH